MGIELTGAALALCVALTFVPWKKWLSKSSDSKTLSDEKTLMQKVVDLRFYCACQPPAERGRGLEACDTLGSLVSQQKLLLGPDENRLKAGGYE